MPMKRRYEKVIGYETSGSQCNTSSIYWYFRLGGMFPIYRKFLEFTVRFRHACILNRNLRRFKAFDLSL